MPALVRLLVVCLILSLLFVPAAAQEAADPLLALLAAVPDTAAVWDAAPIASYADYRLFEAARGIPTPTRADFDNGTDTARLWLAATNGLAAGFPLQYFMQYLEGMEDAVGFGWFAVDRALTFGQPPGMGSVLAGDFDADKIAAAFTARGFTATAQDDAVLWCGADGCDGLRQNLRERNPANPFGGALGRSEPVAVLPGLVLNAADYSVLTAMVETRQGAAPSLADNPMFRAAAGALAARGMVRQVVFFSAADVGFGYTMPDLLNGEQPTFEGYGPLPPYLLMFAADVLAEDQEKTYVGLVYGDRETAQAASEELVARLAVAQSARARQPFMTLIEERGGTVGAPTMHDDTDAGAAVALLEISKPLPPNELQPGELGENYPPSALVFRLLVQSIYARDLPVVALDVTPAP